MLAPLSLVPVEFSLGAVLAWGTSDFLGGYISKRVNAFLIAAIAHSGGLVLMTSLALLGGSALPSSSSILWALGGGVSGGAGLAVFYRALSQGNMGPTATISAVLGAAIPAVFGIVTEGLPGYARLAGFLLAGIGIWLISSSEGESRPQALGLAVLAGLGFAGFFICMKQAGNGPALWMATFSRASALAVTAVILLFTRGFHRVGGGAVAFGVVAGFLDTSGTALFVRASQTGRLDVAVVLTSLYPAVTVLLARAILKEHFTRWKAIGLVAGLAAVPLIAMQ